MSDLEPFPELIEQQRLDPGRVNGVDQARLTIGADGDAIVTFRDEVAEFQDTLGVYLIDPDGTIRDPEIVFARIEHADPIPGLPGVRPGGGPLEPGDDVALSDLYPAQDLEPGQQFGLFIVANGAERNPGFVFDGSGELDFVNTTTGGPANVADDAAQIELRHVADDGTVRTVQGAVFHTADVDPDRLENNLNPGGAERVVSGVDATSGALLLGFEDQRDFDFNDVVIDLGPPVVVPPPIVTPPASLADLDGTNGFRLLGTDEGDRSGNSVAGAGDVNGDGFSDLITGAVGADSFAGESYVVLGKARGFGPSIDLATLDGRNGFRLDGIDVNDDSGASVAAGDVNGDGFADLIIGALRAGDYGAGESYVVFGRSGGFSSSLDLVALDGTNGFRLDGIDDLDFSGTSVSSVGDFNGDGFADLIIGAYGADPGGDEQAGESYVVFGKAGGFGPSLDLAALDGTNGFRLDGIDEYDESGFSVASAGDVNGDGFDDVIIGPGSADYGSGESHVVFGRAEGFGPSLDLASLDGTNGFGLSGAGGAAGVSVASAGDLNGDGFFDLILGAPGAPGAQPASNAQAGESYVVFGGNFTGAVTQLGSPGDDTLTGTPGDDVMLGAQGDDMLLGNGGIDVLNGGEGDDLIALLDPSFLEGFGTGGGRVLGGTGVDTLRLDGAGDNLDLTAIPEPRLQGLEQIDLGGDDNALALDVLEILNLDDASNTLTVFGDDTNAVSGSLPGATEGNASVGGLDFTTFTVGEAELLVLSGIDTSDIDTSLA